MARRRPLFALAADPWSPFVALLVLLHLPGPAPGQVATVRIEENFRMEPNGTVIGRLLPGTTLTVDGRRGGWVSAELEGWVWIRSLQVARRGGFDLIVSADEGENLRTEPRGRILAHLDPGTLLEEIERIPGWIRVRRSGWVWAESVEVDDSAIPAEPDEGAGSADPTPPSASPAGGGTGLVTAPPAGLPVLTAPGGDTLGWAAGGADVEVTGREGAWARVRVEGWAWLPRGAAAGETALDERPADVSPGDVADDPDAFVGRVVSWDLQYVSLERAERIRTDFFEGEPFLLTRIPGGEGSFVYVAVPPDRMGVVEGLTPLERVRVTGRIRAGASALTGTPILDLLGLERLR